jgi:hypothetical protein
MTNSIHRAGHRLEPGCRPGSLAIHDIALLFLASAVDLELRAPGRADRGPVQPVRQQVGVADRSRPAGQDEKYGLEGVLGMMQIAEDLTANIQDHRPMPAHEWGKRRLADRIAPRVKPLEKLPVGQPCHRAALEERFDLPRYRT